MHMLAQQRDYTQIFIWSMVLIGVLIVLFLGVIWLKRWMMGSPETTKPAGFTLSDLRELRRAGQMTDEEFEKAKALLVGNLKTSESKPESGGMQAKE